MTEVTLSDLPSRGVHPKVAAAKRLDPYWDGLWASGSTASWVNVETARRQRESGLARMPAFLDSDPDAAWEKFTSAYNWRRKLEVLGALGSWRTLSGEQLAAMVGAPSLAGRSEIMDSAIGCGLVDAGIFTNGLVRTRLTSRAKLFRPAATRVFADRLAPLLTYPETVLVTGGGPYSSGGQFDRHNLLTTELALRLAEFAPIGAVLGESFSTLDLLVGTGIGNPGTRHARRTADATVVRSDGMRIAIELTASVSPGFEEKVQRWALVLAENPMSTSGLTVLFVGAPAPDRSRDTTQAEFMNLMRKKVRRAISKFPGVGESAPAARIGVAMWEDYFPAPGMVDAGAFMSLAAMVPAGPRGSPWVRASFLDEFDMGFTPLDPDAARAVITTSANLACSPIWLRRSSPVLPMHRVAMAKAGFTRAPVAVPTDARNRGRHTPEAHYGSGAGAQLTARLNPEPLADEGLVRGRPSTHG